MSIEVPSQPAPFDPNVRNKIVSSLMMKFAQSKLRFEAAEFVGFQINTKIGQPSFEGADLPMIHISLGPEQVDQYLGTNLYKDFRSCSLLTSVYVRGFFKDGKFQHFNKENIREGVPFVENVTRLIGTLILEHEAERQPKEVVWAQFSGRNLNISEQADPKVITSTMTYNVRYALDLNHPFYNLGYTLPEVPPANFE